jgi:penicillin-binding protein 1A
VRKVVTWLASFVIWVMVGTVVVGAAVAMLIPASSGFGHSTDSQARAVPPLPPLPQRSTIYDRQGNVLQYVYYGEDRSAVEISQVPQKVIDAVLSVEDRDFYNHSGVDVRGIFRAFLANVGADTIKEGGSTITQQLVKNTLFPDGRPETVKAKLQEAVLAERLEQSYTKSQILERYLNTIYFGEGAYGIQAATERYFGKKSVSDLSLAEGALLAGIIKNPSGYDPILHPAAARARRHEVLSDMVESGYITTFEAARYDEAGLPGKANGAPHHTATYAPNSYFVQAMENWLISDNNVASAALGNTPAARQRKLYQGGLKITTTLDPALEQDATNAVTSAPLPPKPGLRPLDAAIAVIDNNTGAVRAIANRTPYSATHQFDVATNGSKGGKQPGSSFKVFTLAAALANGYSPNDAARGGSCHFDPPQGTQIGGYDVKSDEGGAPSLTTAIAKSINCSFVNLEVSMGWGRAGPKKVAQMADTLGLQYPWAKDGSQFITSLTLGTIGVTPLQMAAAYSTLAANGVRRSPVYVTRIVNSDGQVLYDRPDGAPGKQVIPAQNAETETSMLEGTLQYGTATSGRLDRPAAGKTGTTTDGTDLWFTGYTPQLTASVWVGIENPTPTNRSLIAYLGNNGAFGGSVSAPIWKNFMDAALADQPIAQFTAPDQSLWAPGECVSVIPAGRIPCHLSGGPAITTTPTTAAGTKPGKGKGGKGPPPTHGAPTTVVTAPPR